MSITNAMTVDVEDYFQVSAFESVISREDWGSIPMRVEQNMDRILAMFSRHGVKATFFTLGSIAERYPGMIRKLVAEGHELASHGWDHTRATEQTPDQFREDVARTRKTLQDIGGVDVNGYRAASYSISTQNLWVHDVLADEGYVYSSSVAPLAHDLYGIPDAPRFSYETANGRLTEIPVSTRTVLGKTLNVGGGGWFRLFPYAFSKWAIKQINQADGQSAHFYFHPWEVDPEQPRVEGASAKSRFRHYLNLDRMENRLDCLLQDFSWDRMDRVFLGQ